MSSPMTPPTAVTLMNTAVVPARAAASVAGWAGSQRAISAPAGRAGSWEPRVSARTAAPSASNPVTRWRPTLPVAPVTRIIYFLLSISLGASAGLAGGHGVQPQVLPDAKQPEAGPFH